MVEIFTHFHQIKSIVVVDFAEINEGFQAVFHYCDKKSSMEQKQVD